MAFTVIPLSRRVDLINKFETNSLIVLCKVIPKGGPLLFMLLCNDSKASPRNKKIFSHDGPLPDEAKHAKSDAFIKIQDKTAKHYHILSLIGIISRNQEDYHR